VTSALNPANAITVARALLVAPFWLAVHHDAPQWALLALLAGGLGDKLDGYVAKRLGCQSELGAVLDALADGLLYGGCFLVLAGHGWVPWWPVLVLIGLGLVNLAARMIYARRAGRTLNYRSYAMERFVAYTAFLCAFALANYEIDYFYSVAAAMLALIVVHDCKRMLVDPVPAPEPGHGQVSP
jgi:phosphatidylglycerophosphate synthase